MRFAKVKITDHRPPGQSATPPLERNPTARPGAAARPPLTGLDHWSRIEASMQAEHDKAVRNYSTETAFAALSDLGRRPTTGKDPETRWIRHRKAALARKLHAPELIRKSA